PLRGGLVVRGGGPRAGRRRERSRSGKDPPLSPRRDLPSRGRRGRGTRLLRPSREPLPGIQEPPRVPRGLRLPQRHPPPELTAMRRLLSRRLPAALLGL